MKFNFPNKFSVYLHDTNQRSLFSKEKRALSHGCVRVQAWNELASYLLVRDSIHSANATPLDSLQGWLSAKEKRVIPLRKRMPLFIRYYTCDAAEGKLVFYEDIYGEDRKLQETYFATK
jgi:murein L,D-transpeptidase YcbB/YkuD